MDRFSTLRELTATTFGISPDSITPATKQQDITEWDSVGHLNLMLSIEDTFGVKLDVEDMTRLTSIGAILTFLESACPSS